MNNPNQAKEVLLSSDAFFQKVLESSINGIYVYDIVKGSNVYINSQYTNLTGYTLEEINNMGADEFFALFHPDDQEKVSQHMQDVVTADDDSVFDLEYRFKTAWGQWIWLLSWDTAFERDDEGKVRQFIGTFIDNTARKKVEKELRIHRENLEKLVAQRTAELEAANKELEAFSYSVSHDLRAPLRAMDGFSKALFENYREKFDETGLRWLTFIRDNTLEMDKLIQDILAFSRVGRHEIKKEEVDMGTLVDEVLNDEIRHYQNHEVELNVGVLPPVMGDEVLIKQVWRNLISNAFKYSSGNRTIEIEINAKEKNKFIIYTIKDNGVGFDEAYKDKLFEVFQRLHSEKQFKGTGIGLAIVSRIVHRHGGEIWANSKPDEGAVFSFSVPV